MLGKALIPSPQVVFLPFDQNWDNLFLQSRVRLSRKLSLALLAQKLHILSLSNSDLNFLRFQTLAGSELNWLFALILSPTDVQDTSNVDNGLRRIFVPQAGRQKVIVNYAGSLPLSVTIYGAARSYGKDLNTFNPETKLINPTLSLFEVLECQESLFHCHSSSSSTCFALIHEIASGCNKRIKKFYWKLWFGDDEVPNMMFTRILWVWMLLSIPVMCQVGCLFAQTSVHAFSTVSVKRLFVIAQPVLLPGRLSLLLGVLHLFAHLGIVMGLICKL